MASRRSAVTLALTTTVKYGQPHTEASEATRALEVPLGALHVRALVRAQVVALPPPWVLQILVLAPCVIGSLGLLGCRVRLELARLLLKYSAVLLTCVDSTRTAPVSFAKYVDAVGSGELEKHGDYEKSKAAWDQLMESDFMKVT